MGNISEFVFHVSVAPEDGIAFLRATGHNPKGALKWFIEQVVIGAIEPEEFRNAVGGDGSWRRSNG